MRLSAIHFSMAILIFVGAASAQEAPGLDFGDFQIHAGAECRLQGGDAFAPAVNSVIVRNGAVIVHGRDPADEFEILVCPLVAFRDIGQRPDAVAGGLVVGGPNIEAQLCTEMLASNRFANCGEARRTTPSDPAGIRQTLFLPPPDDTSDHLVYYVQIWARFPTGISHQPRNHVSAYGAFFKG